MAKMSYREALTETLHQEMANDENVIVMGEDVVGGTGSPGGPEAIGGVFGVTGGLFGKFGAGRVIDMPISEAGIAGTAAGAALAGKRPVAEIMFADFIGLCMDQLMNQAAKFRYMFGGKATCPMVLRTSYGAGMQAASQHSQSPHPMVTAIPGLKVAMPSTAADAKGLLTTAIRDDDPVIFFEHKTLYGLQGEVPEGDYLVPFGKARIVSEGTDCTLVATGRMVSFCEDAAKALAADGISCDIIDPRTTSPLDEDAILDSVEKTGRLIVVDETPPRCSFAADVAALAASEVFSSLKAPIKTVTGPHSPVPFAKELENAFLPSPLKIKAVIEKTVKYS